MSAQREPAPAQPTRAAAAPLDSADAAGAAAAPLDSANAASAGAGPGAGAAPGARDAWQLRFDRQARFAPLGREGQARLQRARVLVVGCGALGGACALYLARAGVGALVLVDRDIVEESNLPRQLLFEAAHARAGTPKALAAAEALARLEGPTRVEPHCEHVDAGNLAELARGADLILDGSDNLATRYLLNDYAVQRELPWIYAGVVGSAGLVLPVLPRRGACLRCLFPEPAPAGSLDTCESAGVLGPAVAAIAALQCGAALRVLARGAADFEPALLRLDVWTQELARLRAPRDPDCPCCARGEYPFLAAPPERAPVALCGRNTVQLPAPSGALALAELERRLAASGLAPKRAGPLLRFEAEGARITLFADGRALIEGTSDALRARALYDRYVGR